MNDDSERPRYTGRCLCGAVGFSIAGAVEAPVACHCAECARQSGGVWIAATAPAERVSITRERLGWVRVSPKAFRGFCRDCGGFLFWQPVEGETIDVALGAFDRPHDLTLAAHVHVAEALMTLPDDGLPRYEGEGPGDEPAGSD
ncbi:MAG: GFA family protein [Paracoccaceae bacterium]